MQVRVTPRASRTAILATYGDGNETALRIALQSPPVEGRANAAWIESLEKRLEVPRSAIEVCAGEHGRNKLILIRGRTAAEVSAALSQTIAPHPL